MGILKVMRAILGAPVRGSKPTIPPAKPQNTFLQDIYFTSKFHAKAREWGLTEDHARHVYYQGDPVPGKENWKVATTKTGEERGGGPFPLGSPSIAPSAEPGELQPEDVPQGNRI